MACPQGDLQRQRSGLIAAAPFLNICLPNRQLKYGRERIYPVPSDRLIA